MSILEAVSYCETSPTKLRWKVKITAGKKHRIVKCLPGDVAGSTSGSGSHFEVTFQQRAYWCHRVVWELHYGPIPSGFDIDHINGSGLDNRIENLRLDAHAVNMHNRRMANNNPSGTTGVAYYDIDGYKFWCARWSPLGTRAHKMKKFSVAKHGYEQAKALAIQFREDKIKELNEQGAGYSERHGKD